LENKGGDENSERSEGEKKPAQEGNNRKKKSILERTPLKGITKEKDKSNLRTFQTGTYLGRDQRNF